MSGPALARRLTAVCRALRVLFMSGYTDDTPLRHGLNDLNSTFLQKPITPESLCRKVREVLDAPRAA